jgi:hypothetical protein
MADTGEAQRAPSDLDLEVAFRRATSPVSSEVRFELLGPMTTRSALAGTRLLVAEGSWSLAVHGRPEQDGVNIDAGPPRGARVHDADRVPA